MDRVALGRQGEIYVMHKLIEMGWKFPANYKETMDGLDWVFEKDNRIIKIQVKASLQKRLQFGYNAKTFDYLITTDLKNLYIIPKEILPRTNRLTKTFQKCKNQFELLELKDDKLLSKLIDLGISPRNFIDILVKDKHHQNIQ